MVFYMDQKKRRIIISAYIWLYNHNLVIAQYGYWTMHNNINRLHERALRIIYLDDISTFEELLKKDNSVKIHTQNSQILAAEMFKVKKGIATSLLEEVFQIAYLNYNLENKREFKSCNVKTVFFLVQSLWLFFV